MISIVTATNDKYMNYVIAMIQSIYSNTECKDINIHILYEKLCSSNRDIILKCFEHTQLNIEFLKIDKDVFGKVILSSYSYSSYEAYSRILIPEILNKYDKVIYLDADTILLSDVMELYSIDISGHSIGCVRDFNPNSSEIFKKTFNLNIEEKKHFYFNSGVMLMNLKRLREQNFTSNALQFLTTTEIKYSFFDQDIFNYFFYKSYKEIDPRWNVQLYLELATSDYRHSTLKKSEYFNCKTSPYLVHFTIIKPDKLDYIFFKYRSKYIGYLKEAGIKFYFSKFNIKDFLWTFSELFFFKAINVLDLKTRSKILLFLRSLNLNRI